LLNCFLYILNGACRSLHLSAPSAHHHAHTRHCTTKHRISAKAQLGPVVSTHEKGTTVTIRGDGGRVKEHNRKNGHCVRGTLSNAPRHPIFRNGNAVEAGGAMGRREQDKSKKEHTLGRPQREAQCSSISWRSARRESVHRESATCKITLHLARLDRSRHARAYLNWRRGLGAFHGHFSAE